MIKIIDLYSGNPNDFTEALGGEFSGVIFKAGQGNWLDVPNIQPDWWKIAGDKGLKRGWYWVCDSRYHSSTHIDAINRWRDAEKLDLNAELGFWSDIEYPYIKMTTAEYWATPYAGYKNVVDFQYLLKTNGINAGVYSGDGMYNEIMKYAPNADHDYLADCPFWPANYPYIYIPGVSKPRMFGHWTTWRFWQYHGNPDYNEFNGTLEEFEQLFGGTVTPPPQPGDKMVLTSLENGLRIRTGAGTSFSQVTVAPTYLDAGQTAEVISLSGAGSPMQWAQIGEGRWINVWYNGYQNARLDGILPPPPSGQLPVIHIHQLFSADGYPDKIIDEQWSPNA